MNNYEFHKDAIEAFFREGLSFAMTKREVVTTCNTIGCEQCIFSKYNNPDTYDLTCGDRKTMWALREHVEKPKLTKQEYKFCELLKEKDCWFTRDLDETLCVFLCKPHKKIADEMWYDDDLGTTLMTSDQLSVFEVKMPFIKWQDEEPWSVAALLELEVEDGD